MKKTFADFVDLCCEEFGWPDADVRRVLASHLEMAGITERDIEVYLNYPAMTEAELAAEFGLSEGAVSRALARVRRAWPSLLRDPEVNQHGSPALHHMKRIETSANSDDRLNDQDVIKF